MLGPDLSFMVLVLTTISTTLIVYRIIGMARKTNISTPYYPVVEILVESGAMYTVVIFICCAFWTKNRAINEI